jgi:PleD family two-component response regulator
VAVVGERPENAMSRVDELLYKAKRAGRNTIRTG